MKQEKKTSRLGRLLKLDRYVGEIGVREAATVLGISAATYSRIENGKQIDADTQLKLINWFFSDL